jgi:RNAse (barnase) inhibitor barstar
MEKPSRTIDGMHFETLEGFFLAFQDAVLDGAQWGSNLDAFNDVLRGGFGSPDGGFILIWKNHATSQEKLGFKETGWQLERRLTHCHPATEAVCRWQEWSVVGHLRTVTGGCFREDQPPVYGP